LGDKIKKYEMSRACGMHEEEKCIQVLAGKPERKRPFGKSRQETIMLK
jgi:hypothetical protein